MFSYLIFKSTFKYKVNKMLLNDQLFSLLNIPEFLSPDLTKKSLKNDKILNSMLA